MNAKKSTWFVQTRGKIYLYRFAPSVCALIERAPHYSGGFSKLLAINIGEKFWWMWDEAELCAYGEKILHLTLDEGSAIKHFDECDRAIDKAIAAAERARLAPYASMPNEELIAAGKALYEGARDALGLLNFSADAFDYYPAVYIEEKVRDALKRLPENERARVSADLLTVSYSSYLALEEQAILSAALAGGNAQAVADRFWWTSLGWESAEIKDEQHFRERIQEANRDTEAAKERLALLKSHESDILAKRRSILKHYALPAEVERLLSVFDRYARLHDRRKELQMRVMYSYELLRREAVKRLGLDDELSEWLWHDELLSLLGGKPFDVTELQRRKDALAVYFSGGSVRTLSGKDALALKDKELNRTAEEVHELRGMAASPGFATGIVKVCAGAKDAREKIREGDILVTGMTLPDYVPAMKRAAAIVTDEGGITSHAAIVSRELKKPCIIGTKIATEVFRDGDLIEVDANHGMIKLIKRAS